MFGLIATTQKSEGIINIPVLNTMTNGDMAQAILNGFPETFNSKLVKRIREVKEFVKTLKNDSERVYINPHCEVCEDSFICSFDFDN